MPILGFLVFSILELGHGQGARQANRQTDGQTDTGTAYGGQGHKSENNDEKTKT